ncbi:hypothetical protein M8494_27090 [Serratia ureilytica]
MLKSGMKNTQGRSRPVRSAPMKCWRRRRKRMRCGSSAPNARPSLRAAIPASAMALASAACRRLRHRRPETSFARVELSKTAASRCITAARRWSTGMSTSQSVLTHSGWANRPTKRISRSPTGRCCRWSPAAILPDVAGGAGQAEKPNWTPSYCSPSSTPA